ncbi:MAG: HD domain-containing protein, partial [Pseudomonadales bacterium]|nr:HD domain-containing protein [Pseudomonadales bacterium]
MQTKADIPVTLLDDDAPAFIRAWFEIVQLKQLYRQGWLKRGISTADCETVAEHTFGNAMLCLLLARDYPALQLEKVLRLALVHDIGEAYVGDITPHDRVEKSEKTRLETEAVERILGKLPNGASLIADWHEYEAGETAEARFVKQVDRLELALQASVYGRQGKVDSSEFLDAAEAFVQADGLKEIIAQ